jgi:hypothetical protein
MAIQNSQRPFVCTKSSWFILHLLRNQHFYQSITKCLWFKCVIYLCFTGNACYHLVQSPLPSSLLSKNANIIVYKFTIWPVVLYRCENLSLVLKEEHRLRVFENKMLRRIFGPKRDETIGSWTKKHNEELHNLYPPPNIVWQELWSQRNSRY